MHHWAWGAETVGHRRVLAGRFTAAGSPSLLGAASIAFGIALAYGSEALFTTRQYSRSWMSYLVFTKV